MEIDPRRSAMVPSSITVTPLAATCSPTLPLNTDVPLRLKSPSRPWPTASCSITPGQPAPSTTSISPAGVGTDSRLSTAMRRASSTWLCHASGVNHWSSMTRPPAPLLPDSIRPLSSTATQTLNLTKGRISAIRVPSPRIICTACHDPARLALTCFTRLSADRA